MKLYEAYKIIRDSGLILERDMTPEQREAAKKRRQARRAEKRGDPVNAGSFAVILGNGYPTPDFFREHKPVGTSDQVLKTIDMNRNKARSGQILGFYPTRNKARGVALSVMDRILKMQDSAYSVEYSCPTPSVVNVTKENKRWCDAISGPSDCGYIYDYDKEISREVRDMRYDKLEEMKKREERKTRGGDDGWSTSRNNPDSPIFKNIYAHH